MPSLGLALGGGGGGGKLSQGVGLVPGSNDRFTDLFKRSRKSSETSNLRNLGEKTSARFFFPKVKGPKIFEVKVTPSQ